MLDGMSVNPYDSPETVGQAPAKPKARGFRLIELLVVIAVIGGLIALLLPARRNAGEAARRSQCSNNLKQIALGLQNYHDDHGCFPPAYTVDAEGKPLHSWRTLILPYIEQGSLYEKIDLLKPWDDPANQIAQETRVSAYQCPSTNLRPDQTTYLAVVGPNSCLQPGEPRKLDEITDSTSLTLIVIEVAPDRAVHWMSPKDASEQDVIDFAKVAQLSHPNGTVAAYVDGHTGLLSKNIKPEVLRALISIAGGDDEIAQKDF